MNTPELPAARFPDEVVVALHDAQLTATCLPVRINEDDWQAAVFYVLPPGTDALPAGPFTVGLDADLHTHDNGTLIEIGLEIQVPGQPLLATLAFLTGHSSAHFDAMKLLTTQADLPLFIGDEFCQLLWQQRIPLADAHRDGFRELLNDAVRLDGVTRLTGRYDADAVFADTLAGGNG